MFAVVCPLCLVCSISICWDSRELCVSVYVLFHDLDDDDGFVGMIVRLRLYITCVRVMIFSCCLLAL